MHEHLSIIRKKFRKRENENILEINKEAVSCNRLHLLVHTNEVDKEDFRVDCEVNNKSNVLYFL